MDWPVDPAGMLVMLYALLIQFLSFRRMIRKAEPLAGRLIPGSAMKLYQVDEDIIPFSFGNSIFINHHCIPGKNCRRSSGMNSSM